MSCRPPLLHLLALTACLLAVNASAQRLLPNAPVENFRLPNFGTDGRRTWLARGTEARYISQDQIDITDLTFTTFTPGGKDAVEMVFLAPAATLLPNQNILRGGSTLRVVHNDFDMKGEDWIYRHAEKSVSIRRNVHVIFYQELQSILQ